MRRGHPVAHRARACRAIGVALVLHLTGCAHLDPSCRVPDRVGTPAEPEFGPALRRAIVGSNPGGFGIGDYHAHMFADRGFGGRLFSGKAFAHAPNGRKEMREAMPPCDHTCNHHLITGLLVAGIGEPPHGHDGAPHFDHWPRYETQLHQQMYIDWLYRSYLYGMRLVVVTAVHSETLCRLSAKRPGASCDEMKAVEAQLAALAELVSHVAQAEGGWLGWAKDAPSARNLIEANRLALVAGVEIDTLFGCAEAASNGAGSDCEIAKKVGELYEQGVRHVIPIHLANNAFGGFALYDDRTVANNHFLRGRYAKPVDCHAKNVQNVEWTSRGGAGVPFALRLVSFFHTGRWYRPDYPVVPAHCNSLGLTPEGEVLMDALMARGMLIDLEHMSETAAWQALQHTAGYPVTLSHSWIRELKWTRAELENHGKKPGDEFTQVHWDVQRSEMHRPAALIQAVSASGGVVGLLTNQGYVGDGGSPPPVANDCHTSSKSFAQALHYLAKLEPGPIGLGTDFNGLPGQPSPRFGPHACGGRTADAATQAEQRELQRLSGARLHYDGSESVYGRPLTLTQLGREDMDFNVMGLAHYGLIPDFLADLRTVGVPGSELDRIAGSAMAYVKMWEKATALASP